MKLLYTPQFKKSVKRLHRNQRSDLDTALAAIAKKPSIGEHKVGDLSWLRVYKFRMAGQPMLLAYELADAETIILHNVGSHENFYRDLKS